VRYRKSSRGPVTGTPWAMQLYSVSIWKSPWLDHFRVALELLLSSPHRIALRPIFSSQECCYASLCYPAKHYIDYWRIICLLACLYVLVSKETTWNTLNHLGFVVHRVTMGQITSRVVRFAPVEYLSASCPYSFIHPAYTIYNLRYWQRH